MELPHLQQLSSELNDQGIDIIAVCTMSAADGIIDSLQRRAKIDSTIKRLEHMVAFHHLTMPIGMAPPGSAFRKTYDIPNASMVVINSEGMVVYHSGLRLGTLKDVLAGIRRPVVAQVGGG